jgi:hypothetical protein
VAALEVLQAAAASAVTRARDDDRRMRGLL